VQREALCTVPIGTGRDRESNEVMVDRTDVDTGVEARRLVGCTLKRFAGDASICQIGQCPVHIGEPREHRAGAEAPEGCRVAARPITAARAGNEFLE
jgi:hypothetical protein